MKSLWLGLKDRCPTHLALLLVAFLYLFISDTLGFLVGPFDYNHLSGYYELALRFWLTDPGLPHYNPFLCGGRTLGADPQIPIFHPLVLLVAVLGPTWVLRLEMFVCLALGTFGLLRWLRWWGVRNEALAWGLLLYLCGGAVISRFLVGHVTLGFYFLFPLFFYLSYRLNENRGRRTLQNLVGYLILFAYAGFYKPNFFIYAAPLLLVEAATRSLLYRSIRPVLFFSVGLVFGACADAVSTFPAAQYFAEFPRTAEHPFVWVSGRALLFNLLLPLKTIPKLLYGDFLYLPHEANVFLGPVALLFCAIGLATPSSKGKEKAALIVFALFSALVGFGQPDKTLHWWVPFSWLDSFWPGFTSVRVPVRFWFGLAVALTVFSALGFHSPQTKKQKAGYLLLGVLPLMLFATCTLVRSVYYSENLSKSPRQFLTPWEHTHIPSADKPLASLRQGKGVLECVQNISISPARDLQAGPMLASIPPLPAEASLRWNHWNEIHVSFPPKPAQNTVQKYALNLNHSKFWKWNGTGAEIVSAPGERLTLKKSNGPVEGTLRFIQPWVTESLLATIVAFLIWVGLALKVLAKRPIRRIALTGDIASGKTALAEELRKHGINVIDMDQIAREVRADPKFQRQVRLHWPDCWDPTISQLDSQRLRQKIWGSARDKAWYESRIHPRLRVLFEKRCAELERQGARLVVCEGALLIDTGYYEQFDETLFVTAPETERLSRLLKRNPQLGDLQAKAWIEGQRVPLSKLALADQTIDNSGGLDQLLPRVQDLIHSWHHRGWTG